MGGNGFIFTFASCPAPTPPTPPTPPPTPPTPAPTYYRFENCSTSQFVFQTMNSAPASNARYFNGLQYFRYTGVSTTLPGTPIVTNLTFVGQFGCP